MKFLFIFMAMTALSTSVHAVDSRKCSAMLNNGLWKNYKYGGMGEAYWNTCTQGTKREGSSRVTSDGSTETTTMMTDTKYTSNVWSSQTQSTSSFGECSAFAKAEQLKKDREMYIAQNEYEVRIDIARGSGEHLKVITFYSACAQEAYSELSTKLKKSVSEMDSMPDSKTICTKIDKIISDNQSLKDKCIVSI
jgi:hypothetical protein